MHYFYQLLLLFFHCHLSTAWLPAHNHLENDLVAISNADGKRLCVVRPDETIAPLCQHEDDVETDLFLDGRVEALVNPEIVGTYGEGWYGQRPVPSLGGGPGYGAEAQEIWSVSEEVLEQLKEDGVDLPILDMGIAHGEKVFCDE